MKASIRVLMICGVLLTVCAHADAESEAQSQIRSSWTAMQRSANAHDTDAFMAAFAHRPDLVFAINGEAIRGWAALREQQLKWWHNGRSDAAYAQRGPLEFTPLAPGVWATTATLTSRRTGPDGRRSEGHFVVSYVWKHTERGWRIIYGHESWAKPRGCRRPAKSTPHLGAPE